jgi:Zn-finger nucleic acid-binding protein
MASTSHSDSSRQCPVCVGARMGQINPRGGVALDYCERCGGVWFDRGEAAALRDSTPQGPAWPLVTHSVYIMQCHGSAPTWTVMRRHVARASARTSWHVLRAPTRCR